MGRGADHSGMRGRIREEVGGGRGLRGYVFPRTEKTSPRGIEMYSGIVREISWSNPGPDASIGGEATRLVQK